MEDFFLPFNVSYVSKGRFEHIIKKDVLHGTEKPLPEYLDHLLQLMISNFSEHNMGNHVTTVTIEEFFQMHISLMSSGERLRFIMNCHNKVDALNSIEHSRFRSAVLEMGIIPTGWIYWTIVSIFYILKEGRPQTSVNEAIRLIDQLNFPQYLYRVRQRYRDDNPNTFSGNMTF